MITHHLASASDIDAFYGDRPRESMRAIVLKMDGEPVGIIGLAFEADRFRAFSEAKPALEPHMRSMGVLRAIKSAQQMFRNAGRPIIAVREHCNGLLERLGFVPLEGDYYLWRS